MGKRQMVIVGLSVVCSLSGVLSLEKSVAQSILSKQSNSLEDCKGQQLLTAVSCAGDGLELEERRLYELVNEYRAQHGLPAIPLSPSLTLVANRHVQDLEKNIGELTHSWSDCAYEISFDCMWEAPERLGTAYPGRGYENAFGASGFQVTAESALRAWRRSNAHNAVILNQLTTQIDWGEQPWKALGVGIYGGYAVLWFGEELDPIAQ